MVLPNFISSFATRTNILIAVLFALAVSLNIMVAHFVALQSAQLSAKSSIQTEIDELNWSSPKSELEVQEAILWMNKKASIQSPTTAERLYFFADSDGNPIAGNMTHWTENVLPYQGWFQFEGEETGITTGPTYARVFSGRIENSDKSYKLLIGRQIPAVTAIYDRILWTFLAISLICAVCGGFIYHAHQARKNNDPI